MSYSHSKILYESDKFRVEKDETGEKWTIFPGTSWIEANAIYYEYQRRKLKNFRDLVKEELSEKEILDIEDQVTCIQK